MASSWVVVSSRGWVPPFVSFFTYYEHKTETHTPHKISSRRERTQFPTHERTKVFPSPSRPSLLSKRPSVPWPLTHTHTRYQAPAHTHAHALSRAAPQTHSHPPSYAHTHARIKKPAAHISLLQLLLTGLVLDLSIVLSVSLLTYCACCCWKAFSIVRAWTRARCWSRFHLLRTA